MNDTCTWEQEDELSDHWSSDCGMEFVFNDGGPRLNGFVYCPGCGKKLAEISWQSEGESE